MDDVPDYVVIALDGRGDGASALGPLGERAQEFILHGQPGDQALLLSDCVEAGTLDALHAVQMLFEDMYGGITYNYELKAPAAFCLVRWEHQGLKTLVEAAQRTPTSKNLSLTLEVLATLASGQRAPQTSMWFRNDPLATRIVELVTDWDGLFREAGRSLREYVLSFEDDDDIVSALGLQLQRASFVNPRVVEALFEAMAGRWSAVSSPTLQAFDDLIRDHADDEPSFQAFLGRHPLMIDPMALDVYPQPDIHGAKEPDFLLRRTDNSFLVVEIETPGKPLMTQANKLSAEATHAIAQATDYAEFLGERISSIREHIASFRRPDCLVVVGLEGSLDEDQTRALRIDNESRHRVKVVGYDWLGTRAQSIRDNIVSGRITVTPRLRIV